MGLLLPRQSHSSMAKVLIVLAWAGLATCAPQRFRTGGQSSSDCQHCPVKAGHPGGCGQCFERSRSRSCVHFQQSSCGGYLWETSFDNSLKTSCDNGLKTSCDNSLKTSCDSSLKTSCDNSFKTSNYQFPITKTNKFCNNSHQACICQFLKSR